jgi:NADP-dependent 3-hydroxy acid dehydrogenase YdfG
MSIIVTAATGRFGGLTVDALIERGVDPSEIIAAGRKPDRVAALADRGLRPAVIDSTTPSRCAPPSTAPKRFSWSPFEETRDNSLNIGTQ